MVMSNGREERRRRIAERGSDRLALITGRIQGISSSSFSPTHRDHSRTGSAPPFFSQHHEVPHTNLSDQINGGARDEDDVFGSKLLKQETGVEFSRGNNFDIGNQTESHLPESTVSSEAVQTPAEEDRIKTEPSRVTSIVQKASTDTEPPPKPRRCRPNFFTAKQINSSIIASENKRISCALIIAFLVVLSYIDYPLFGNIVSSESVIASRPLYIVLLSDVTIVLGTLFLEKQRSSEEAAEETSIPQEDVHNWGGAVKVLETGLVLYQSLRAVFIDCSVYAVVVICGLSLV